MTVAQFDPTGRHIFVGTSTGSILVFNTRTKTVSCTFVLPWRIIYSVGHRWLLGIKSQAQVS